MHPNQILNWVAVALLQTASITLCNLVYPTYDLYLVTRVSQPQEIKKNFCCNGSIVTDPEMGIIIQLQGDQRDNISKFLVTESLCDKVHLTPLCP